MRTGAAAQSYDVIIVGVGGMGSAIAAHCAARGQRVLAIEQHALLHDRGSSHGHSRIIRLAYFEHDSYVPLLRRAFTLWRELEQASGRSLLHVTGSLDVGPAGGLVFEGSHRSCRTHHLEHEILDASALARRVPGWRPAPDAMAVFQPDGGFLIPEQCVQAHAERAVSSGAVIRQQEPVLGWRAAAGEVEVVTAQGRYRGGQLVVSPGAWMGSMAPSLARLFVPERQVVGWFGVHDHARFSPSHFPVFVLEASEGLFYGFPEHAEPGFKIGKYHHRGEIISPDQLDRTCSPADESALRDAVSRYFPSANGELLRAQACMFTNTPDEHFVIDRAPGSPEVLLVSPCSGHGFKFSSVIGEICADLVTRGQTVHDIALFGLHRFLS
jgi:sarcosine oxidase